MSTDSLTKFGVRGSSDLVVLNSLFTELHSLLFVDSMGVPYLRPSFSFLYCSSFFFLLFFFYLM